MAIIAGQVPPAQELPVDFKRRVVIKFRPGTQLPYSAAAADELARVAGREWSALTAAHPGIVLVPYFNMEEATLRNLAQRSSRARRATPTPNFALYYAIECPSGVEPESVARAVSAWSNVETAYVEAGPVPPPVNPSDDPRNVNQNYEDAAPTGIDARFAWGYADGSGIGFVDCERGWTLNHEDLAAAGISVISGVNTDYTGHGTSVLGEVVAVDNTIGDVGIAPHASARVVSQWRPGGTYNTAEAILSAVSVMSDGDVLLLEAQTTSSTVSGYVPVEVDQVTFDAIQYATSQGIVVVEAGANGSVDLDAFKDAGGKAILNRNSPDFRDSGAILVGAASSTVPHTRLGFSNYGSRIDCYGWGQSIDTTGDGWTGNSTNVYTTSFGGTSGATPIVTGAALIVQSWRVRNGQPRYSPDQMRSLLSDPKLNTASANPTSDRIGVMPDLKAIITRKVWPWWWVYLAWAWIIIIGGLMITPGGTWCIKCGPGDPGYIGDPVINVLGVVSIAIGIAGLAGLVRSRSVGATR